jgi:TRAP-type transport system small permease protein
MFNKLEAFVVAANRWLLILMLAAMASIVFANVVLRYTTGDSLVWAEEVARHMMIWTAFLGAGLVLRFGGHVAIDSLHQAAGESRARWLRVVVVVGIALFCVVMTVSSIDYVAISRFQTTPATGIPFSFVYAALPVGFALVLIHLGFIVPSYVGTGTYVASEEMDAEAAASL